MNEKKNTVAVVKTICKTMKKANSGVKVILALILIVSFVVVGFFGFLILIPDFLPFFSPWMISSPLLKTR
jgi:hypothetical protein